MVDLSAYNVIDCWWREMRSLRCRVDSNRNEDKMLVGYGREVWSALHEPASQLNCGDDQRWYLFSHKGQRKNIHQTGEPIIMHNSPIQMENK